MIDTWFISDTHFGHKNILEYEKEARPFSTLEKMHEVMIDRWNSVVKHSDIVYHLGDFCFGKHNINIASRLNGKKILILGNHDSYDINLYREHFNKIYGCKFWKYCILSHIPIHPDNLTSRGLLNIHGHLHSKKIMTDCYNIYGIITNDGPKQLMGFSHEKKDLNYFNVSCEQNNLTPIHSDVIMDRIKELQNS